MPRKIFPGILELASWPRDLTSFRNTLAKLNYRKVGAYFKKSWITKISLAAQVRY